MSRLVLSCPCPAPISERSAMSPAFVRTTYCSCLRLRFSSLVLVFDHELLTGFTEYHTFCPAVTHRIPSVSILRKIKIPHSAFDNNFQIDQYKFNKENSLIKGIPDSLTLPLQNESLLPHPPLLRRLYHRMGKRNRLGCVVSICCVCSFVSFSNSPHSLSKML
jgi:hypothetical protein